MTLHIPSFKLRTLKEILLYEITTIHTSTKQETNSNIYQVAQNESKLVDLVVWASVTGID